MKARRIVLLAALAAASAIRLAAIDISSGEIALGEWNKGYARARALADANHIPMLVMWARKSCPRCVACKTAMEKDDFRAWQAERKLVMVLIHEGEPDNGYALGLIRQGNRGLSDLPLLCIYWQKPDGSTVLRSFVGRDGNGTLPVRSGGSVAMQIAKSVDSVLAAAGWAGSGSAPIVVPPAPTPVRPTTPRFEEDAYTLALTQHVSVNQALAPTNLTGGLVRVKKTSGKLPTGVKAAYDASAGKFRLTGTPSKPGTYVSTWRVSEKRAAGTVSGGNQTITCVVESLAGKNPAIGSAGIRTSGFAETETGEVAGTLALQIRPNGKISVKYVGRNGKASLASRAWSGISGDGTLSAKATGRDGSTLEIAVSADGTVTGHLRVKGEEDDLSPRLQFPAWGTAHLATAYVGAQVALILDDAAASGTISVKMPSGGARNGKMTYRGKLPGGRSISGNGILVESADGKTAQLPIVKAMRGCTVFGRITFDAASGTLTGGDLQERAADGSLREMAVLPDEALR